jgi:hypothetical protein
MWSGEREVVESLGLPRYYDLRLSLYVFSAMPPLLTGPNVRGKAWIFQAAAPSLLLTPTASGSTINGSVGHDIPRVVDTAQCRPSATGGPKWFRAISRPPTRHGVRPHESALPRTGARGSMAGARLMRSALDPIRGPPPCWYDPCSGRGTGALARPGYLRRSRGAVPHPRRGASGKGRVEVTAQAYQEDSISSCKTEDNSAQ